MIKKMEFQKAIGPMIFFVIMFFIAYSTAFAVPIEPFNDRPVPVKIPSVDGEGTDLQTILNTMFGAGLNASTDQNSTGMWAYATALPGGTLPILKFEYADFAGINIFGIWSDPDMDPATPPNTVDIFFGSASTPTFAALAWITPDTLIVSDPFVTGNVKTGNYTGMINPYSFGFYLSNSGGTFYTVDQLNAGTETMALAYEKYPGANIWAIAFEDAAGGDNDYNDMVVQVESIKPVPEPGTLALLGSGLISIGIYRWRKMKK